MPRFIRPAAAIAVALVVVALTAATPTPVHAQAPEGWSHIARVIDGDTVELDDGSRIRLYGVSAPELDASCGPEARDVLAGLLADRQRDNWVVLEYGPRVLDDYNRTLAYLWVVDGDQWSLIDEWMVALGFGEAWERDGQYRDQIIAAEEMAVQQGAGCLWSGRAAPTPPPVTRPAPPPTAAPQTQAGNCHPAYPDVCIPGPPPDLDCGDVPHRRFRVLPPDPHRFDSDRDGVGCESG